MTDFELTNKIFRDTTIEWRAERDARERAAAKVQPRGKHENKISNTWRDRVYTAADLQHRTFPEISYCVPDLIPEGLTIIAGKPKIGKSWLALDICIAIAANRFCLGERKPLPGGVLYAAMEDNPRRLQRRIDRLLSTFNDQWPEGLTLTNSWRRLDKGGVDDVRQWIETTANPRLVILDTLAGVKPIRTREGYIEDYESLVALHRLASETGVSIIVLHHTRKMEAEDPVDTVSGTLGLAGCADSVLILARSSQGTTLYVRGRDIEENEHAVSFDKINCRWTILGSAADVHRSNERGKILDVLIRAAELLGPQQIADRARMKSDNVRYLLGQMVESGEAIKAARGLYHHPDRSELAETPSQASQPHK
jgi:AAA domain